MYIIFFFLIDNLTSTVISNTSGKIKTTADTFVWSSNDSEV